MVITQVTLVLRGVSVRRDGKAVGLRLGSCETMPQARAIPISMRHPSRHEQDPDTAARKGPYAYGTAEANEAAFRAGRSVVQRAGVLRRSPASAGRIIASRWSHAKGRPPLTTHTGMGLAKAKPWAAGGATVLSLRPSVRNSFTTCLQDVPMSQVPLAARTQPAASTWGYGGR